LSHLKENYENALYRSSDAAVCPLFVCPAAENDVIKVDVQKSFELLVVSNSKTDTVQITNIDVNRGRCPAAKGRSHIRASPLMAGCPKGAFTPPPCSLPMAGSGIW
jgi:hypothetical protein